MAQVTGSQVNIKFIKELKFNLSNTGDNCLHLVTDRQMCAFLQIDRCVLSYQTGTERLVDYDY